MTNCYFNRRKWSDLWCIQVRIPFDVGRGPHFFVFYMHDVLFSAWQSLIDGFLWQRHQSNYATQMDEHDNHHWALLKKFLLWKLKYELKWCILVSSYWRPIFYFLGKCSTFYQFHTVSTDSHKELLLSIHINVLPFIYIVRQGQSVSLGGFELLDWLCLSPLWLIFSLWTWPCTRKMWRYHPEVYAHMIGRHHHPSVPLRWADPVGFFGVCLYCWLLVSPLVSFRWAVTRGWQTAFS